MNLNEIVEIIRSENPNGLKIGSDETGYSELSAEEYEATILEWAQARLAKLQKLEADQQAALEAEAKRQALLDKLGITEEEAKILLG